MSQPTMDFCDLICELDRIIDTLKAWGKYDEAQVVQSLSGRLTAGVQLRLVDKPEGIR